MGNATSKKPNRQHRAGSEEQIDQNVIYESLEDLQVDTATRFDEEIISTLKKDLSESPDLFVLNNMLMCVMFFENYQKEVQEMSSRRYQKDLEVITPDVLLENVNKNVMYRPLHGPKKTNSETLVSKRLYVINDEIQVVTTFDRETVTAGKATVRMEESSRKGYVKLREVEAPTPMDSEDIPIANEPTPSTSRSSTESDTYGYSTITDIKTPKPIDIMKELKKQDGKPNLPPSCISYRKIKKLLADSDLEDKDIENITDDDLYDIVSYINSKAFMKFFQNNIFPNGTGTNLGFEESEVRLSKSIPGKVFCSFHQGDKHTPCEVIPAIPVSWPHKYTLQFLMKAQRMQEPRKRYSFPTQRMISEIENLRCVMVPKGYIRKKGEHTDSDLEWELQFPQAERYLETFMSHAQAKCYLFLLTLYKTYVEPHTSQLGLLSEHIRSFILWECESNYVDWPEHRLGTKLVALITSLNVHIAKSDLRDYFIKEKNLFQNIPKKYLRYAQKVLHEVLESPVMSFIKSLRNLRYTRGKHFYHPFDFDALYDILVNPGIQSTNSQLTSDQYVPPNFKKIKYVDADNQIKHLKEARKKERILKKRQREEIEKKNLKEQEERRGSVDSVDLKWRCDRQFDVWKTRLLLNFFIKNFIDIAKKCSQISSHKQMRLYLKQVGYLTRILRDKCPAAEDEAREFVKEIQALDEECSMKAVKEDSATVSSSVVSISGVSPSAVSPVGVSPKVVSPRAVSPRVVSPRVGSPIGVSSKVGSPSAVQNGTVHFTPNVQISNSKSDSRAPEVPKVNGIVKPRKSVMFVESH